MMDQTGTKIRVGISSCLLGQPVRFDGGHKHDRRLTQDLNEHFAWVPVCPEVELGLGAPREALRLVQSADGVRMRTSKTGRDLTDDMADYARRRVEELRSWHLRGYILKRDSPTCGMERVKVYNEHNIPERSGTGLYAEALLAAHPNLPVEEEGRLNDPKLRENFMTRVFAYDRWLQLREAGARARDLVDFHTRHKMLLLAHQPDALKRLGQLVANAGSHELESTLDAYESAFMDALSNVATRRRHVNALQHLAGFLRRTLDDEERSELHGVIADYARGWVPLVAPMTLLKHHLRQLSHPWANAQLYLEPYPRALRLRNRI